MDNFQAMLNGEAVVLSDKDMDALEEKTPPYIRSLPNPNRVGVLDRWLCFMKEHYRGSDPAITASIAETNRFANGETASTQDELSKR